MLGYLNKEPSEQYNSEQSEIRNIGADVAPLSLCWAGAKHAVGSSELQRGCADTLFKSIERVSLIVCLLNMTKLCSFFQAS